MKIGKLISLGFGIGAVMSACGSSDSSTPPGTSSGGSAGTSSGTSAGGQSGSAGTSSKGVGGTTTGAPLPPLGSGGTGAGGTLAGSGGSTGAAGSASGGAGGSAGSGGGGAGGAAGKGGAGGGGGAAAKGGAGGGGAGAGGAGGGNPSCAPPPSTNTNMGSVGGTTFATPVSALWIDSGMNTRTIFLFSRTMPCSSIQTPGWDADGRLPAGAQAVEMKIWGTTPATFRVVTTLTPAAGEAACSFTVAMPGATDTISNGGTVTLCSITANANASGLFALTFTGGLATGTFNAMFCAGGMEP